MLNGRGHGGCHLGGRFHMERKPGIFHGFLGGVPEGADGSISLDEIGKILKQGLYSGGAEKYQEIIIFDRDVGQVTGECSVYYGFLVLYLIVL